MRSTQGLKKIASILLILLLFFNWYGYRLVIAVMQDDADQKLESRIDKNNYDESQLIEVRVALNMPYQERFTDFERHYGEINIDGKIYRYVKRKIEGDILILKCIPNQSKQELSVLKNEWAKANNGNESDQPGKQQHNSSLAKNFWSKYDQQDFFISLENFFSLNTETKFGYDFCLSEGNPDVPFQPPKC